LFILCIMIWEKVAKSSQTDSIGKGGSLGDKKGAERKRKKNAATPEASMKLMIHFSKLLYAIFFITLLGCQSSPDFETLRKEILDLHKKTIEAHWNKDVGFFIKDISEDYMSVGSGELRNPTKEEITSQFSNYLNNTTFTEYRDLREPIINFSNDGSIAWSVVQVKVAGKRIMNDRSERDFDDTWAWITLYRREGDKWIRLGEVSNRK